MTNAELITAIRENEECNNCAISIHDDCNERKMSLAAADALEAISKTVIPHRNYENCHVYWCDCGWFLRNKDHTPNYCPNCGKRIEWENAE